MTSDARQDGSTSDMEREHRSFDRITSSPEEWRQFGRDLALAAPQARGEVRTASAEPSGYRGSPVDQVAEQLAAWARLRSRHERGSVQVRLHPEVLGELMIEVSWQDGGIVAAIKAQNSVAGELLASDLSRLRTTLTEQGIPVFDLGVQVGMDFRHWTSEENGFRAARHIANAPGTGSGPDREPALPTLLAMTSNSVIDILV